MLPLFECVLPENNFTSDKILTNTIYKIIPEKAIDIIENQYLLIEFKSKNIWQPDFWIVM